MADSGINDLVFALAAIAAIAFALNGIVDWNLLTDGLSLTSTALDAGYAAGGAAGGVGLYKIVEEGA